MHRLFKKDSVNDYRRSTMIHTFKDLSGFDPKDFDDDGPLPRKMKNTELPRVFCKEHPNASLIEDSRAGDTICKVCALVVQDRVIDVGAEWRTFDDNDIKVDPCRVGVPANPFVKNGLDLSTLISGGGGGGDGQRSGWSQQITASDRTLLKALRDIDEMGSKLNMAQRDIDEAKSLCSKMPETKVKKCGTFQGWTMDCLVPACVYLACQLGGVPRTSEEICAVSQVAKKRIKKYSKIIEKALKLDGGDGIKPIQAVDCLPRFCSKLKPAGWSQVKPNEKVKKDSKLLFKVEKTATAIARRATDLKLMGQRDAASVSAGAISMSAKRCGVQLSRHEIADVVGLSDSTVKKSFMILHKNAHKLVPADVRFPNQKEYPSRKTEETLEKKRAAYVENLM